MSERQNKGRSKRLASEHYDEANWLSVISKDGLRGERSRLTRHLKRLCADAGTTFDREDIPGSYIAALKALEARDGETMKLETYELRGLVKEYKEYSATATATPKEQKATPGQLPKSVLLLPHDNNEWRHIGVPGGCVAELQPAPNPYPRQILIMYRHAGELDGWLWDAGRFLRFENVVFDGDEHARPAITLEVEYNDGERGEESFLLATWTAFAVTDVRRKEPHGEKIAELRERLDKIDADDITDSTARFNVEREIYRLENEPPPADEWTGFDLITEGRKDR
jgi:hypothetical protein